MLKSLYNFKTTDINNILDIRSETVYPLSLSASAKKYIFRLEPNGYLDKDSMLLFKLKNVNDNQDLRVNIFNGALGAINRATLSIGDYTLNDTDSVNKWSTLHHLSSMPRSKQNAYLSHYLGNQLHTEVLDISTQHIVQIPIPESDPPAFIDDPRSVDGVGSLQVDPRKSGIAFGGYESGNSDIGAVGGVTRRINSLPIGNDIDANHQYAVPLGLIFPALQGRSIPLFIFNEYKIYITVYFNTADKYINDISKYDYLTQNLRALPNAVTIEDVKLQVDYLLYPSSVQEVERKQIATSTGYVMDFFDVTHIMKSLPKVVMGEGVDYQTQKQEFKIGITNREIHRIYMTRHFNNGNDKGRRNALMLDSQCDGINLESYNFNINGTDVYSEDLTTPAQHYEQLTLTLRSPLDVERPMYYTDENTEWSGLAGKWNPLQGTYKPLALDLTNGNIGVIGAGTVIGQYPIIMRYSRTPHKDHEATATNIWNYNDKSEGMNVDFYVMNSRRAIVTTNLKGGMLVNVQY